MIYKLCSECDEWYEMNEENFYTNKKNKTDGFYPYCIACAKLRVKVRREENWDAYLDYSREYYKFQYNNNPKLHERHKKGEDKRRKEGKLLEWQRNNPDKVKINNEKRRMKIHEISIGEWSTCKLFFNNSCAYCGFAYDEHKKQYGQDLHKDHANDKGSNKLDNCLPSCKNCNSSKHRHKLINWFRKQQFFTEEKLENIINWLQLEHLKYIEQK